MQTNKDPRSSGFRILLWITGVIFASLLAFVGVVWLIFLWYVSLIEDAMHPL
jgi:hypothetical protein